MSLRTSDILNHTLRTIHKAFDNPYKLPRLLRNEWCELNQSQGITTTYAQWLLLKITTAVALAQVDAALSTSEDQALKLVQDIGFTNGHYKNHLLEKEIDHLYCTLRSPEERARFGIFLTPHTIVGYLLDRLGYHANAPLECWRVLEPACGTGAFVIEISRRLISRLVSMGLNPTQAVRRLRQHILAMDADPIATMICSAKLRIMLTRDFGLSHLPGDLGIYCADALTAGSNSYAAQALLFPSAGFEVICGNPPYGELPINDPRVARFRHLLHGRPNLYALFLCMVTKLLHPKGRLGLIMPRSFSSGSFYRYIRSHLWESTRPLEVTVFNTRGNIFKKVEHETILIVSKGSKSRTSSLTIREAGPSDPKHTIRSAVVRRSDAFLAVNDHTMLFLSPSPVDYDLLRCFQQTATTFRQVGLRCSTGQIVWNRMRRYLRTSCNLDARPLVWAHQIRPYEFRPEKTQDGKPPWTLEVKRTRPFLHTSPDRILMKRTSAKEQPRRIEAARPPDTWMRKGFFIENHVNFVWLEEGSEVSIVLALALLNSFIVERWFRASNGNTHVSAFEVEAFPFPTRMVDIRGLKKLVEEIEEEKNQDRRNLLSQEINARIEHAFRLPTSLRRALACENI